MQSYYKALQMYLDTKQQGKPANDMINVYQNLERLDNEVQLRFGNRGQNNLLGQWPSPLPWCQGADSVGAAFPM